MAFGFQTNALNCGFHAALVMKPPWERFVENLKIQIKIEDNDNLKEAHDLLLKLGFSTYNEESFGVWDNCPKPIWLKTNCFDDKPNKIDWVDSGDYKPLKEITLPELRDLVVLKRNDVGDATHVDQYGDKWIFVSGIWYFYSGKNKWDQALANPMSRYELKPIEKPMKEYLRKNNDGEYILEVTDEREAQEPHAKHWIEIPEGANFAWKSDGKYVFFTALEMEYRDAIVVWNRHTLPEALPFIDDEPLQSLNDQYAEIEKVSQSHRTASETSNPTIKETLNQRQSQYGSFEDVAQTTEQLFQVIKGGASFVDFTESQRMALYMIFSKVARLSNGDCNHKDSWHDIAGYATLIDEVL